MGSWFIMDSEMVSMGSSNSVPTKLQRIPRGREDVFADKSISLKEARSLMKFLKFVADYKNQQDEMDLDLSASFRDLLTNKFALGLRSQGPILALALSNDPASHISNGFALPRIARYLKSIGAFGPRFGAVIPKWGGTAEITQVACRAGAVGGGTYILGKGVEKIVESRGPNDELLVEVLLEEEETPIKANLLVGSDDDIPDSDVASFLSKIVATTETCAKSISIISSPLASLFPDDAEGSPAPAGAVIYLPSASASGDEPPIYIIAHSAETGECPTGQCKRHLFSMFFLSSRANDETSIEYLSTLSELH
jgi:Rab proteins geranylgeranyltransferase component A